MLIKEKVNHITLLLFVITINLTIISDGFACSGYKITIGDKTILGVNEDAWRVTPHIWFEGATENGLYGAAFTGSRFDGANGYAPQAGMNEEGLAFERLASYHPIKDGFANRKSITNPTKYLKHILHTCKSVEEVQSYISEYDHSFFIEDVFIYADKSGKYLIVEPFTLTIGNEPTYVISNFCPSITSMENANKLDRYRNGSEFLKINIDSTLEYCTALSERMHVCREKIGDGTLLTSIWDLHNGKVNLYFYHDYSSTIQFDLKEELTKGDHSIALETIFPLNADFEKLRNYKTPKNSVLIGIFIVASAGFFLLTAIFFLIQYIRKRSDRKYTGVQLLLFPLGLLMFYYMIVLSGSINVFYFPAPYKHPANLAASATSYIPFLLLLLIIPFCVINFKLIKYKSWSRLSSALFTLNNLAYVIFIGLFTYWEFYDVFG